MSVYVALALGGIPLGAPVVGAVAQAYGPRAGLLLGGGISALAAVDAAGALLRARSPAAPPASPALPAGAHPAGGPAEAPGP